MRDRTREFFALVESLSRADASVSNVPQSPSLSAPGAGALTESATARQGDDESWAMEQFMASAAHVSSGIDIACARVEEARRLAGRRSVFARREDDEIGELRGVLKRDFANLSSDIERLSKGADMQPAFRRRPGAHAHTRAVARSLQSRVTEAAKAFAEILEQQNRRLRDESRRRARFESSTPAQNLLRARRRAVDSFGRGDDDRTHSERVRLQQLQQIESEQKYASHRSKTIQNIESTLSELGNVYSRMATLVASQGEVAIRIDENIEAAREHVDAGHGELVKLFAGVTGNRAFILKIFAILIAFALFFTYLSSS